MNEDLGRRWTVTILANLVCLSPSAFYRTFSRHVGMTPMAWLTDARVGEMARLLRETNEPLHVVARRVGWATTCSGPQGGVGESWPRDSPV
ncbi:helix-turn-helix transcriptional regulator [uncultured Corynebacterium sp.]|uniref:helix-turn-helix transcriptional regulator n=1 Tax=uncultured Corynebacterium sp. TaxID=159447 RepID=UPI00338F1654